MSHDGSEPRGHYRSNGYAFLPQLSPPKVTRRMLAVISRDMSARPGALDRLLTKPRVNAKPAYEFYGYRYLPVTGFHWGLTSKMCDVTGRPLTPSYAYFRVYQKGDICTVHSDRPSCEHSLSLALGYADDLVWNFGIGHEFREYDPTPRAPLADDFGDEDFSELALSPGDAIVYKGVNLRHGRTTPNPNRWSAHLFLHWVDSEGPFREWAFDKQALPTEANFPFPEPASS